jgi:hypothetical protein
MPQEEKRAWILAVVSIASYLVYAGIVLSRAGGGRLVDVRYAAPMLWTIGAAIVASIVLSILVGVATGTGTDRRDQRDREIGHRSDQIGQSFVVIGGVATLLMAIFKVEYFWIANVVYLTFTLSAILGSVARIGFYRGGLPRW